MKFSFLALLFPAFWTRPSQAFSQLFEFERMYQTHINMLRSSPERYCNMYNLTSNSFDFTTRVLTPFLFHQNLYLSAHFQSIDIQEPIKNNCTYPYHQTCGIHCLNFKGCESEKRISKFCPQCRDSIEFIVFNISNLMSLTEFQNRVLMPNAGLFLEPNLTALALVARSDYTIMDVAELPIYHLPIFFDGAHYHYREQQKFTFWVNSYNVLRVTIIFYNQNMQFLDEFQMTLLFLNSFTFSMDTQVLRQLDKEIQFLYYTFHANLNARDHYSEIFSVTFE